MNDPLLAAVTAAIHQQRHPRHDHFCRCPEFAQAALDALAAPAHDGLRAAVEALLEEHLPGDYTHMFYDDPGSVDPPVDCHCGHRREWGVSHHRHVATQIAALSAAPARDAEDRGEGDGGAVERVRRWTIDDRPVDVVDGRLVEPQHTTCVHGVPLVESACHGCRAALDGVDTGGEASQAARNGAQSDERGEP